MTDRATKYLDETLRSIPGFRGVYFGGPPQGGEDLNPCIIYSIEDDNKYGTLRLPGRVVGVDFQIVVRSSDSETVETNGQRVWSVLAGYGRRIRDIGPYKVDKFIAQDGDAAATEYFAIRNYRVRVR